MTGGIMPKLFAVRGPFAALVGIMPKMFAARWPIAAFAAVSLIAATIGFATTLSSRPANDPTTRDNYAGERQQLLFFKAAVGRIDEELRLRGAAATSSLRSEREAVLQRMREVASRVPPERLPPDLAAMLPPGPPESTSRPPDRSVAKVAVRDFQTGLGIKSADIDFDSLALDRPPPLPVYVERAPRRAEHPRESDGSEKHAERPARERPAKDPAKEKERTAAEKRPAKEQPPAERAAATRPPVTVERTAVVDQLRQQPVR
jgi:hypothetical protein